MKSLMFYPDLFLATDKKFWNASSQSYIIERTIINLATLAAEAATRNRPVRDGLIGAGKFGLVHSLMNAAQTKKQVRINKP